MNVKLVVVQGKPEGKDIPILTAKFLIGRGPECHLRPNSELISRHHCLFVVDGNGVTLRDLGSTNGTLVNGERISGEVTVCNEDLIQLGPLGFRMVIESVPTVTLPKLEPTLAVEAVSEVAGTSRLASPSARNDVDDDLPDWLKGAGGKGGGSESTDAEAELLNTKAESGGGQDTQHDLPVVPAGGTGQQSPEEVVTLESGRKMKVGNAKAKIDKTRDDTSQAAAGILRRIMDRRSRQ